MQDKNFCQQNIKEHVDFFNSHINKVLFAKFLGNEMQNLIDDFERPTSTYLKQHTMKTFNLLTSIIVLATANEYKPFVDEGKIIFRSLFENIINFFYIFSKEKLERINLINRFYDYIPIAYNHYARNIINENNPRITEQKIYKIVSNKLNNTKGKDIISEKIKDFCNRYNTKNVINWSGIPTKAMLDEIISQNVEDTLIFYEKYFYECHPFVHCNILAYRNEDDVIIENRSIYSRLELIHESIFITYGYLEALYSLFDIKINEIYNNEYKLLTDVIFNEYHEIMKDNPDQKIVY